MDASPLTALRTLTLLAFTLGLPAWAILSAPTLSKTSPEAGSSSRVARPQVAAIAPQLPTASITALEPTAENHANGAAPATPAINRFSEIQERIKALGSTYILLESIGGDRQQFRFHCDFAPLGDDASAERFEAIDANPLVAMERVLAQAEEWSAARVSLARRTVPPTTLNR